MTDPNHSSLAGRVAIVTGGGTGIGRGVALALARAGADTVVAARTPEPLEETCAEVRALGRRALAVQTDVTDTAQVGNMVARAMDAFGRVDVLVNNAGGNAGPTFRQRLLLEMSAQDIDETFTVNVRSMLSCSQAVAPIMNRQEQGAIINVASRAGRESTAPSAGGGVYPASKAAVVSPHPAHGGGVGAEHPRQLRGSRDDRHAAGGRPAQPGAHPQPARQHCAGAARFA